MRIFAFSLIYMMFGVSPAYASLFVDESTLPAYMLDQKDELFYREGIIRTGGTSSLCGPTSVMNWLQLRNQNAYSKIQLVNFVQVIGNDLRAKNIEINNGLTEFQLLEFLKIYNDYLGESTQYVMSNSRNLQLDTLFSEKPQILLLRYREIVRASPFRPNRGEPFKIPVAGAHFVLKIAGDADSSVITVIDPEAPGYFTKLRVVESVEHGSKFYRIDPLSKRDLFSFTAGVNIMWNLSSTIEEQ